MSTDCTKPIRKECVKIGDSTENLYFRADDGVTVDVCTCRQAVYPTGSSVASIGPSAVTDTRTISGVEFFKAYLTPAQTATLTAGTYHWVIEITGDMTVDPPFNEEVFVELTVVAQKLP